MARPTRPCSLPAGCGRDNARHCSRQNPRRKSHTAARRRLFSCLDASNREVQAGDLGNVSNTFGWGPELTGKRFPDVYLTNLLADPKATFGRDALMPDLELTSAEIAALTAFINRERPR